MITNIYTPNAHMLSKLFDSILKYVFVNGLDKSNLSMTMRTINQFAMVQLNIIQPFGIRDIHVKFVWDVDTDTYEVFYPEQQNEEELLMLCRYLNNQGVSLQDISYLLNVTMLRITMYLNTAASTYPGAHIEVKDQSVRQ